MEQIDDFFIAPILNGERNTGIYQELVESMQLLGLSANICDTKCYEVLQIQQVLLLCMEDSSSSSSPSPLPSSPTLVTESSLTASSPSLLLCMEDSSSSSLPSSSPTLPKESSFSASSPSLTSSSPSLALPTLVKESSLTVSSPLSSSSSSLAPSTTPLPSSSSSSLSPPPPQASALSSSSSNAAAASDRSTSGRSSKGSSCDLCLASTRKGFFEKAEPCGHLFCPTCILQLDNGSSDSSEDRSCIIDGCKGYLALAKKPTKVLVYCPFCNSLQLPQRELLAEEDYTTQCCYCQSLF